MKKLIKEYIEKTDLGTFKIKDYGQIKVKTMIEPSVEYKKKLEKRKIDFENEKKIKEKAQQKEKIIKKRMREIAIRELENEGLL